MSDMNILAIGASRNIGYQSAVRLLEKGATVTFLLRSPAVFDNDAVIQRFVATDKARLVKGDATSEEDLRLVWNAAGVVDAVVFSVGKSCLSFHSSRIMALIRASNAGGTPSFSLTKGIVIDPPNLVTQCMLNLLCTLPKYEDAPQPKIVAISSIGLTPTAHKALPLLMKPLYSMLDTPHKDKVGLERVLFHCAGWEWDATSGEPEVEITGAGWQQRPGLPAPGTLKHLLIVRPAWLTDGKSKADQVEREGRKDKLGYRYSEHEISTYGISRADIAHFVANSFNHWDELENKAINVGY
ncbi:NAD(P)-bd-dom domain-containing protein [Mycena chlorophos]|uniref:NAD(P)-bd-dom domain-containing protein n=1 Tax=Mycena chlorophos TaxID=658473 RepID=A0A8H6SWG6_MYCCL|nr:NAD(P)-bd-dom domain-containing protein [Mycena chlorophos]